MTKETYQNWKYQNQQLVLKHELQYDPVETLALIDNKYLKIKERHFELPKLLERTFVNMKLKKKCCKDSRVAHSHSYEKTKSVCFSQPFLKRRCYVNRVGNTGEWRILENTLAIIELLTHEISHWKVRSGVHNKQFYKTQKRYLDTAINLIMSGEYYK